MAIKCYLNDSICAANWLGHTLKDMRPGFGNAPKNKNRRNSKWSASASVSWFSQPVHSAFIDTESEASDARIRVLLLNSNLAAKMKRLPQPTNKHYLNFKTSRGQGEFIIVLHWNEVGKGTGRSPFKIFHWVILYLQPGVETQRLRQQTYFLSLLITLWTTRHDTVHRESENKYRLISCNLSNDCRDGFFFFFW